MSFTPLLLKLMGTVSAIFFVTLVFTLWKESEDLGVVRNVFLFCAYFLIGGGLYLLWKYI